MNTFFDFLSIVLSLTLCAWISAELTIKYYKHKLRKEIERRVKQESKRYEKGFNDAKELICDNISLILVKQIISNMRSSQYKNGMEAAISVYECYGEWE